MSLFKAAKREKVPIKIGIQGPSGAGKTYSALLLAFGLGNKVAVIDTENGSAQLYSDLGEYDTLTLTAPFHPDKFIEGIKEAVREGYDVIIIDSLSHSWDEVLNIKNEIDKRGGNSFTNWRAPKKLYDDMMNYILQSNVHVICCMRSKMEYALGNTEGGKSQVQKLGMAPKVAPDSEYEYHIVFDLAREGNTAIATKDRTGIFSKFHGKITVKIGEKIREWYNSGAEHQEPKAITSEIPDRHECEDLLKRELVKRGARLSSFTDQKIDDIPTAELYKLYIEVKEKEIPRDEEE